MVIVGVFRIVVVVCWFVVTDSISGGWWYTDNQQQGTDCDRLFMIEKTRLSENNRIMISNLLVLVIFPAELLAMNVFNLTSDPDPLVEEYGKDVLFYQSPFTCRSLYNIYAI